ncbi:hypothetical protein PQO03_05305 [Lentisphaera profundi]|uniref:Uncharacterized protein n=1 Tax=Lentisphaera profundi TaxID=1658616 RepID=A0ABY7VT43_9BACT|nr:hypothetical protein [Lentisphaera profundi]WDE97368.1 hypothetical protein PQO03_05305 [Lentisphaera profundi]
MGEHKQGKFNVLYQPVLLPKPKDSMSFTSIKALGLALDNIQPATDE